MARKAQITIYTALKDQGFKKAEKGLKNLRFQAHGLNSSLAKLGAGVGVAQFARKSLEAAIKMESANAKLSVSLTNIGQASAMGGVSIKKTSEAMANLGFTGESTASALANLVTITGSLDKAQSLMGLSADAARFLHTDLADAATKLGKAYAGGAKGLLVFGIKLDKTLKPAQAFEKAMGMLNAKISGQAAAYAGTYAGKLEILKAKFEEVQIQVGEKLLPVLVKLGDFMINTGIPALESFFGFIANHQSVAIEFAAAITGVALAFKSLATYATLAKVAAIPIMAAAAPFIAGIAALLAMIAATETAGPVTKLIAKQAVGSGLSKFGRGARTDVMTRPQATAALRPVSRGGSPLAGLSKPSAFDAQAAQRAKELADTQKQALALAKKEAAIKAAEKRKVDAEKKLSAMFDLNQIALANALKLNLTEKERAAVEGLQALQDDGYKTEAQRMLDQEAALRKLISLRTDLASIPFYSPTLAGQEKQASAPIGVPVSATQTAVQEAIAKQTEQMNAGALAKALQTDAFTPAPAKTGAIAPSFSFSTDPSQQGIMTAQQSAMQGLVVNINAPMVTPEVVDQISSALNNKLKAGGVWYQNAAIG